jgi:hypothetical protein
MHALSTLLLCALPLVAFAGQSHRGARYYYERKLHGTRSSGSSTCNKPPSANSTYKLTDLYQGSNFFEYVSSFLVVFGKTNRKTICI